MLDVLWELAFDVRDRAVASIRDTPANRALVQAAEAWHAGWLATWWWRRAEGEQPDRLLVRKDVLKEYFESLLVVEDVPRTPGQWLASPGLEAG